MLYEVITTDRARFPVGRVVPFAPGGRAVAVLCQHLGDRGAATRPNAVVAGIAGGEFRDRAGRTLMVIATGQEGNPRGRADRRRMETIVANALSGQLIECRSP